jgi:uncharacterized membrane protein AbrB (regulator of aidB expression)
MTLAHIIGIPVEESFLQLAPVGAATVAVVAIASHTRLSRLPTRIRRRAWKR